MAFKATHVAAAALAVACSLSGCTDVQFPTASPRQGGEALCATHSTGAIIEQARRDDAVVVTGRIVSTHETRRIADGTKQTAVRIRDLWRVVGEWDPPATVWVSHSGVPVSAWSTRGEFAGIVRRTGEGPVLYATPMTASKVMVADCWATPEIEQQSGFDAPIAALDSLSVAPTDRRPAVASEAWFTLVKDRWAN